MTFKKIDGLEQLANIKLISRVTLPSLGQITGLNLKKMHWSHLSATAGSEKGYSLKIAPTI